MNAGILKHNPKYIKRTTHLWTFFHRYMYNLDQYLEISQQNLPMVQVTADQRQLNNDLFYKITIDKISHPGMLKTNKIN